MIIKELNECIEQAELLFNQQQIQQALMQQADSINLRLAELPEDALPPLVLTVMNGGLIYAGQLLPLINAPLEVDYIHATRYKNTTDGTELEWKVQAQNSLEGRMVIILDDILDEGITLDAIIKHCHQQKASQVLTVVMVTKLHDRRLAAVTADYSAIDVPDRYVFGFGMDYKGQLRNLDSIYALKAI